MAKKKEAPSSPFVPVEEQPYPIPENWCWVKLEDVSEIIMGQSPAGSDTTDDSSYIPLIGGAADMGIMYPLATRYTKVPTKISKDGDLILCIRATLGKPIFSDGEYCLGRGVAAVRPYTGPKEYYRYFFLNFEQYLYDNATGTTFAQVSSKILQKMPVPLSPRPEQQRLVTRIESLFAKLDEAKEKAQAVVDGFEVRKSAILHKAFTGGLTEQWRKEHSASPNTLLVDIEKFSCNWQKKDQQFLKDAQSTSQVVTLDNGHTWIRCTIGAISRVTNGSTPSRKFPQYWDGTIPWVSSGEVRNNIIENTNECISQEGYDNSSVKLLPVGTVLIAMIGEGKTRGQSAILAINAAINQNIAAVIVDHDLVSSRYIWYWFQMNYARNREKGSGTGPQALNCQRVRELDFFVPSLPEQKEVVRILDMTLSRELQAKKAAEVALSQIDTMKKAILARAFCGELGTNDPAEEWAGELVKEILKAEVPTQPRARAVFIPEKLEKRLESELERKIIKLYLKSDSATLSIDVLMAVSSKKFGVMDALRNLEQRGIIKKLNNGNYSLVR